MRSVPPVLILSCLLAGDSAIRAQSQQAAPVATRAEFDVASVKPYDREGGGPRNSNSYSPQGITFGGCSLGFIIGEAYNFPAGRIVGPGSLTKEALWASLAQGYDIVAKSDHEVPKEQLRLMLQSLLTDRFKLTLHHENRTESVYRLTVARGGAKLEESNEAASGFAFSPGPGGYVFRNAEMPRFTSILSGLIDRNVVDETALKGSTTSL